jgi:hypothetical protein
MTPRATLAEVYDLTTAMVSFGLSNEQNFPYTKGTVDAGFEISVANAAAMSVALKNLAYEDIYRELDKSRCFNFKMLDGALVTLRYRFDQGRLLEHSLCFFPSSDLERFQSDPDIYLTDDVYAEVGAKNVVPFPIRFDFSADADKFVELHHPYSHLTLGQYENCRISVFSSWAVDIWRLHPSEFL